MRKWLSNEAEIIQENNVDYNNETNKTLGLRWQVRTDLLIYIVGEIDLFQKSEQYYPIDQRISIL